MSFHTLLERREGLFQFSEIMEKGSLCTHTHVYAHSLSYGVMDGEICGADKEDKMSYLI